MNESQPIVVTLPRFSRWMKYLSVYAVGVAALLFLYRIVPHSGDALGPLPWIALSGFQVIHHFEVWRVMTYALAEVPSGASIIWTVVAFWLIGSPVEQAAGPRRIAQLIVAGVLGGALAVLGVSLLSPTLAMEPVLGMAPISGALLSGWGFLNANQTASFFPGAPAMKGKTLALVFVGIAVVFALFPLSAAGVASVGGIAGGAAWMFLLSKLPNDRVGRRGPRSRRASGEQLQVIRGGRKDDKRVWN